MQKGFSRISGSVASLLDAGNYSVNQRLLQLDDFGGEAPVWLC